MFGVEFEIKIHDESVQWIKPILEQWVRVHRDYIEANDCDDSLYWYNERANVGALAGAIWRVGGFALEEYGAIKGKGDDASNGRVDLYFDYAGRKSVAEAKQAWVYLAKNSRLDFRGLIDKTIESAKSDIIRTQDSLEHAFGFGLAFLPTYSSNPKHSNDAMNRYFLEVEKTDCAFFVLIKNISGKSLVSSKGESCDSVTLIGIVA